ncbi:carotenoid cleavage dioxygenase-like enzyme [Catenulispora sp. GP43]|uniref:carotenoid oxygenase family protein n=1 Tax=Catenulispora sp. GP43 TaxID=3156263 RepID=UPI003514FCC5
MPDHSRFRTGLSAPVTEEITAFDLPVTGRIPPELAGRHLRNGPNPLGADDPGSHWLLGAGMIHGVRLRDGRAEWYRNRWVRSREVATTLGEPWPGGPVHAGKDAAPNTHVLRHAGRILATMEAGPLPYELSEELGTVGPCDFDGTLGGGFAAHTKADPRTGELHAITYFWSRRHVRHVVVDASGKVTRTTEIPLPHRPMMHDFALTERYVVLFDLPMTFSKAAVAAGHRLPYSWDPAQQARVGLLPRDGAPADVRWFEIEPCWLFHALNAYDDSDADSDRVVVDVLRYARSYEITTMDGPGPVTFERWTISLTAGTVARRQLDDRAQEFPRVDERVLTRPHRYGYSAVVGELNRNTLTLDGAFADAAFANTLLKYDFATGTTEAHNLPRTAMAGEAVFVPRAPDVSEDDGYLLAYTHNPERGAADLLILAAQDFAAEPLARIHLPARIPLGFHGNWLPDE